MTLKEISKEVKRLAKNLMGMIGYSQFLKFPIYEQILILKSLSKIANDEKMQNYLHNLEVFIKTVA